MELISVIVPVYNVEKWVGEALESLRSQTYGHFEAILVNDGSTDGSEAICRRLCDADPRFRLVCQPNQGLSAARNTGLAHAKCEWIFFLDADDMLFADSLEVLLHHARKSGALITVGRMTRRLPSKAPSGMGRATGVPSDKATMMALYQKRDLNRSWGTLYHASVFNSEPALRYRICTYEDLDLFYRAFERVPEVCLVDRLVYYYRDTPGSILNSWKDSRLDVLDVTDRIVAHMAGRSPQLLRAALDRRFSAACNMLLEMRRHGVVNPEQRRRCLNIIRQQRAKELLDPHVRLKNRTGALLGPKILELLIRKPKYGHTEP